MLPTKGRMEYMTEMHRLFPKADTEVPPTPIPFNSDQFLQSTLVNRSSSSTDSTSPESYPDLSFHSTHYQPLGTSRLQDTPFITRPQRAIVGRKILGSSQHRFMSPPDRMDRDFNFWQNEECLSVTPPRNTKQPKNYFYELFPSENKVYDFKTPVKSEPKMFDTSPNFLDRSPLSNNSPTNRNLSNLSPLFNQSYRSQNLFNHSVPVSLHSPTSSLGSRISSQRHHSFTSNSSSPCNVSSKYQNFGACSSTDEIASAKMCTFCRKNGETPSVYMDHNVKEQKGNKNVVTCPILRSHVCVTCGASGDNAHTITYCPVLRSHNNGKPLQSTTITLKNTRIKSNGRRRY